MNRTVLLLSKVILVAACCFGIVREAQAQIGSYTSTNNTSIAAGCGSYTSLIYSDPYTALSGATTITMPTGTGSLGTLDDGLSASITLPFTTFSFGGVTQTTLRVSTNGWIGFGAPTNTGSTDGLTNVDNIIAFCNADLNNSGAVYSYVTSGTAPNRIFKIQAANFYRYNTSTQTGNAQVWLYEGSNLIELRYGTYAATWATTVAVGIRGASGAVANVRSYSGTGATTWTAPILGNSTASVMDINGTITPTSGQVISFRPSTYAAISGTTIIMPTGTGSLGTLDDGLSASQTIPFTFTFGGTPFTTYRISTNGWIGFGSPTSTGSTDGLTTVNDIIAFCNRDLNNVSAVYQNVTVGATPNRIHIIQAANFYEYNTPARTGNVQVWLYESSNRIEFHYGTFATSWASTVAVGLRGASGGTGDVRSYNGTGATTWTAPTLGTSTASTMSISGSTVPVSGQTISWVPPSTCTAPGTQASNFTFVYNGTSTTVNWTSGSGAGRVVYVNTTNSFTAPTNGTNPSAATAYTSGQQCVYNNTSNSVTVTGLTVGNTYWVRAYEYCSPDRNYNTATGTNNPLSFVAQIPACTNSTQFPSSPFAAPAPSATLTIATNQFQSEYNQMTGATAGNTFISTGSIAGTYITVRAGTFNGTVVTAGTTPLSWTATAGGIYFIHYNTNSACGTASSSMTSTVQNTTPAAPANDLCAGAIAIPASGPFPYLTAAVNNAIATDAGDPTPTCRTNSHKGIWYTFNPAISGNYRFSMCPAEATGASASDNILSIYTTAACGGTYTEVACNDDAASCSGATTNAIITSATLTTGTTYYILASSFSTNSGTLQIQVSLANDLCIGAVTIPGAGPFPYLTATVNNTPGSNTGDPTPSCQSTFNKGIWYSFTPTVGGNYRFSTCPADASGSAGMDNILNIVTGTCGGSYTSVICNDDNGTACPLNTTNAVINTVALTAATQYWVLAYGYSANAGNLQIQVTQLGAPTITSFSVSHACVGTTFTVNGTNLTGCSAASVNGVAATIGTVTSTSVVLTVPNTTAGPISLTCSGGTVSSAGGVGNFTPDPLPTATYTVGGGGTICPSGTVSITLSSSQSGVSYQLYNGASPVGTAMNGNGGLLTFGPSAFTSGTYTIIGTTTLGCTATMTGSATVVTSVAPVVTITANPSSGPYCVNGPVLTADMGGNGPVLATFTGAAATFIECSANTGDDRGGIVATQSFVYLTGDTRTARFNHDLSGATNLGAVSNAIFSDLSGSGTIYTFANAGVVTPNGGGTIGQVWALDALLATVGSPINLSASITLSTGSTILSGFGYVLVHSASNDHFYRITLPGGIVTDMGVSILPSFSSYPNATENWAQWGYSELSAGSYYAIFRRSGTQDIVRYNVTSGVLTTVQSFTSLSDMANIVLSPWDNRLYVHWEGSTQWGGSDESIGYLPVTLSSASYLWNTTATTQAITASSTGTYSVTGTAANGCSGNASLAVTVSPLPTAAASTTGPACAGSLSTIRFTFTGTGPWNFTYSSPGGPVTTSSATSPYSVPGAAVAGSYQVTALSDANCTGTSFGSSATQVVNPLPTAAASTTGPSCAGSPSTIRFTFTGTGPWNFTYSSPGGPVTTSSATSPYSVPGAAVAGSYQVTALSDANCTGTSFGASATQVVNPLPTAAASSTGDACAGSPSTIEFTFTGTGPWNFTYNSPGGTVTTSSATSPYAVPGAAVAGSYQVTALSDANNCTGTSFGASATQVVNPMPTATLAGNGPFCGSGSPQLSGTLTGTGPWSITYTTDGGSAATVSGIVGPGYTINPAGPISSTTTYEITAISDFYCSATSFPASVNVVVNPLPTVTCGSYGPYCSNDPDVNLGGSPAGGTWTGNGVSVSAPYTFDPSAGTQQLTYTYSDGTCSDLCNTTITVNTAPDITCPANSTVCTSTPSYALTGGSPAGVGGTYSGTGVSGNNFDAATAGPGTHTITYSYVDGNGCTNTSCTFTITVEDADTDEDGTPDYCDGCPLDDNKTAPGTCGCGNPDPGSACDDGLSTTGEDTVQPDCSCLGVPVDCNYVVNGPDLPGTACDDGNPDTWGDTWSVDCLCEGQLEDCEGIVGGTAYPGTPCDDGDGDTGDDTYQTDCSCVGQVIDCMEVAGGTDLPGTPCNDNNNNTADDEWQPDCECVGTVICAGNLVALEIGTDGKGEETDWAILPSGGGGPVCSGPAVDYADNAVIIEPCCLPNGCYILRVYDSFGDGMTVGGYRLKDASNVRIIDNWQSGAFTSTSAIANNGTFCVPIGTDAMQTSSCDALNLMPTSVVAAVPNGAVTGQYGLGSNTDDGYQFWIYDPDGSYSRMIFKSITNPGQPGTPAGPTAPAYLKLSSLTTLPVPTNVKLNIKVRSRVNGLNAEFGPACTMMIDVLNQCPTTSLVSTSGSQFSCGATGKVVNASGNTGKIFCTAVAGANKYQWRFQKGSYTRTIASANTVLVLGAWGTNPLLCGTFTYNVSVHASFDNGATYCPYGAICTVGITNSAPNPCTAGGGSLLDVEVETGEQTISLWPNPVREGSVTLDLTGLSPEATTATVDVVDMFGKRVMALTIATDGAEELNTVLQLDDVATGLYVVNVTSGTNTFTERLVVE